MSPRRHLRRLLPLLAFAVCVPAASAAAADPYPIGSPTWNAAVDASVAHWGPLPCAGQVDFTWAPLPDGVVGYASWMRSSQAPLDATRFSGCRIELNPAMDLSPELFCTTLAHEIGHLHGHDHVDDPADLMARNIGEPISACVTAMAPLYPAAAAPVAAAPAVAASATPKPARAKKGSKRRKHAKPGRPAKRTAGRTSTRH